MTIDPAPTTAALAATGTVSSGPARNRRRIWPVVAVIAWAVLLVALASVSAGRDEPTVREQRSIAEAVPVVHRALDNMVAAAGPDVVVELSAAIVDEGCRINSFRAGATLEQSVLFHTAEADGTALLDRIAQRLPASYQATARHSEDGTVHTLRADAGEFVRIKGGVTEPGLVTLTATTGCRPAS